MHLHRNKKILIPVLLVVGLLLIFAVLELSGVTHVFHSSDKPATISGGQYTKGEPRSTSKNNPADQSNGGDTQSNSSDKTDGSTEPQGSSAELVQPSGSFVSNHHPNLSGAPSPNTISSVCTTTPGAYCSINFTQGSTKRSLPAQKTDGNGSTYWNARSVQSIGLGTGSWTVEAVATLNGQSKQTPDALTLEVAE